MLPELLRRLASALEKTGAAYQIVLVDDASPDDSWQTLVELQRADPDHVVVVQLMRNYGQHNALMCGFRHARGRVIVTMDDDLQNPPEEIPKLLDALTATSSDVVYGVPDTKRHRPWRNLGSLVVSAFYRTVFKTRVRPTSFRAVRKEIIEAILPYSLNYTFIDGLLAWNTQRLEQVTVEHCPRGEGRSGYSFGKLLVLALNLFTNFSLLPLQFASFTGLVASVFGVGLGMYYLIVALTAGITVPGYASTIIAVLVLGGLQLLSLGVIGEYLGRVHLNINRKPQFTIRHILDLTRAEKPAAGR
jgi:undecaprenyl-phosphate 4-deoxy-4-formamido-L-arabinose transferase